MKILSLETSSPVLSVALKNETNPVRQKTCEGYREHVENMLVLIHSLLQDERLSLKEIDTFLIGRGPGSFTGLRVGFATLKGFLAYEKRNCYGALSLDMIAAGIDAEEGSFLGICLDARRGKIYSRFYERKKDAWQAVSEPGVLLPEEVASRLPQESHLAGDALLKFRHEFERDPGRKKIHFLPESCWYPSAAQMISCFLNDGRHDLLKPLTEPKDFVPLYFRLSEAEERKQPL
ncbi:MAG: tRNA (adenosine(37)-N6)-threonylcarbamoyltransferase complex dimerization subunit type 1 TsaB [Candidatus Omnitrophica bacterium]|nr:tRNA (adenosine(37)-N6)-threonylcarbamoyltransferase complex dimerization subunit type 1 TsaB [Candidatus Omnitrophota bacterium]